MKIVEVKHPLVKHKLGLMRAAEISTKDFRELATEVGSLLTYEATKDLEMEKVEIDGWCGKVEVERIKGKKVTVVPILRAGLGMMDGVLEHIPSARKIGITGLLITNPRDIPSLVKELKKYRFVAITGVNTLFNALLNSEHFKEVDFSALKLSVGGGASVQSAVAQRWVEVTGSHIIEGYGMTECSPLIAASRYDSTEHNGSIGIPMPNTDIRIVDDEGNDVPIGERGELWVKGPQVMQGYWNRPEDTAEVLKDGWMATGDIVVMGEDLNLRIVDRKKDMIIVSGFNVYPNEIEDVVAHNPKVNEVVAVGVPHPVSGETIKIFVTKKDESLTREELRKYCRQYLTGYKIPREIEFRDELPKTNVGKILRRVLRDEEIAKLTITK